jgi:D-alanyl-D-alanine carboxypeptidase (penicillin-binding protein 5/6)
MLETHGAQRPAPIASAAKLITALSVLRVRPLHVGQPGPIITLSRTDVDLYKRYAAEDGSVVPVRGGERISEFQMLEAMLLPSADNIADSLARWAFGSIRAYSDFANHYVPRLRLAHTRVGRDASGFAPTTTSTASDLVRLGEIVMTNPVLAGIVDQRAASGIPLAGTVTNINFLLGRAGIVGIKTGNTTQAGGVFIAAAALTVNARPTTIVTAVMGAPTLGAALRRSLPLIRSAEANLGPVLVVPADTVVGRYRPPWATTIEARTSHNLVVDIWHGSTIAITVTLRPVQATAHVGQAVGRLRITSTRRDAQPAVTLTLRTALRQPSLWWRLLHP